MGWVALVFAAALLGVGGFVWWQSGGWRLVKARRVVVNLRSGQAIGGLLVRRQGPLLFIAEARLFDGDSDPVPVDGQAVIERSVVDFIQVL